MKTVKLKDVSKRGWRISPADRMNLNSIETSKAVQGAMATIAKAMDANIAIVDKIAERLERTTKNDERRSPRIAPAPSASMPVEVIMPPADKTKKAFRVTPVRDENGLIEYVDIQQL
jgi:hypothetical protein